GGNKSIQVKKGHLFLVLISTFFVNFDSALIIPIIANYAISLGASIILASVIVGIYSLFHIPSNIFLGRLIDKFGRKGFLILGIFLDGLAMLFYYLAFDPYFLLFARILHGIGGGFGGPATMSYLADSFSNKKSGRSMAFYGISVGFSMLLGVMIGGILASSIGYQNIFLIIAVVMFFISLFCFTLPVIYEPPKIKSKLKEELKVFKNIITNKNFITPYLSLFAAFFNLGILTANYTVYLKNNNYSDAQIGMILGIAVIFSILMNYPAGKFSDKFGKLKFIYIGLVFCSVGFVILLISPFSLFPYLGMMIYGLGQGMIFPVSASIVKDRSNKENRGIATGLYYALNVGGIAIGAPISGTVTELSGFFGGIFLGVIVPLIVFFLIFFLRVESAKEPN
ncbi:MAG: MFS transporter, partial [Candidatus Lokiarchaeota archaeon]|nr:MFS transporter [Candidatus Lokiarchaeota archaeon]MBD3198952.1 MFS transporter [Candidatus Lokiarchaeota archaeon]